MTRSHLNDPDFGESQAAPVPFDVLRALLAARQAATPTCRMIAARQGDTTVDTGARQLIDMFARGNAGSLTNGTFASGEPVAQQDERHA
jgi:hypothetical protein